ncbi:hypothetical protein HDE_13104 [Halotydeus destructor]|nr:hypothetical protein HDE_13104 [Halotydeus destructor]
MLNFATIHLSLLLSLLSVANLSKGDCDTYSGPKAVANAVNNTQDGFVVFANGVKVKTAGPLRHGAPAINFTESQPSTTDFIWVYYNGTHLVSRQHNYFASQEVDDEAWKRGNRVSQELIFQPVNLITAYEDKLLMQLDGQQVFVKQGIVKSAVDLPSDKSLHPKELTRTKDNDVIAFFGPLVGLYEHAEQPILPVILQQTKKYWLSRAWLGCEPDLCFDGSVDAASSDGQYLELYKGKHIVKVNMATKGVRITAPKSWYFVDAAFRQNGSLTVLTGHHQYTFPKVGPASHMEFPDRVGKTEEAAFSIDDAIYLIYEGEVRIFRTYVPEVARTTVLWPELPDRTLDGAAKFDGYVYLFMGDYYYRTPYPVLETNRVRGPFSTQFDLLNCKDDYYEKSPAAKALDIHDTETFKSYISQFQPRPTIRTTTPSLDTKPVTKSTTESTRPSEQSSSSVQTTATTSTRGYFYLFAMIPLLLVVLIALVAFLVHLKSSNKPLSVDQDYFKTTLVTLDSTT